jgi:hypothetical protein
MSIGYAFFGFSDGTNPLVRSAYAPEGLFGPRQDLGPLEAFTRTS